jgi:hypothetical protein
MGAVTAIILFLSVPLHGPGHSVVALPCGISERTIMLFLFGGVVQIGAEPTSAIPIWFGRFAEVTLRLVEWGIGSCQRPTHRVTKRKPHSPSAKLGALAVRYNP